MKVGGLSSRVKNLKTFSSDLSLYIIKRFRRRRRVKNREGGEGRGGEGGGVEEGVEESPQVLIILSPPKAGLF